MADEKKKPPPLDVEARRLEAFELLELTAGELLAQVTRAADALTRLADRYAPETPVRGIGKRGPLLQCGRGHGMAAGATDCDHCWREDHPQRPGPRAA